MAELLQTDIDSLDMSAITAVNKVHRLLRKIYLISQSTLPEADSCKELLNLDKLQVIRQVESGYEYYYKKYAHLVVKRSKHDQETKDGTVLYLQEAAYETSAFMVRDKLRFQINEWHEQGQVFLFDSLTLDDEHLQLPKEDIRTHLNKYLRDLRTNGCSYCLVFERGSKKGRPHFHALYNSPKGHIRSQGRWPLGRVDTRRAQYLGDGFTREKDALENGWSREAIAGYMVKYISKNTSDKRFSDGFHYRTAMSRGFGIWKIRMIVLKLKFPRLLQMYRSRLLLYSPLVYREVSLELARRIEITMEDLERSFTTMEGGAISEIVKSREVAIGASKTGTRMLFDEFSGFECA